MTPFINTYELSLMQAGMLLHAVSGRDPGVDIEQIIATRHERAMPGRCEVGRARLILLLLRWTG